jgi:hypothetical protein
MATTPQSLTPEQVAQIVAAGRGNTVNIGGTLYGADYADTGSGETFQEGALQNIYGSSGQVGAGLPYYEYDPTGAYTRTGTQQKVGSFFGGLGEMFSDPVFLAALGGAGYAGLLGGGAAGAAGAETLFAGEALADAGLLAGGGGAAAAVGAAGASGLTASQIANLAKAGISVAGLIGAGNAVSNIGSTRTPATTTPPITYSGGGAGGYSPDYFSQVQSSYNQLMPNVPRDVASPLQNWYSTEFNPGASVTGSLFGDMTGGTTTGGMAPNTVVKPVTPPVVKPAVVTPPATAVAASPLYASLTKTSSPTNVANAYADFISKSGGNTAANRKAATDYLTNLGLTPDQIGTSYNTYLSTLPAAGNTYQQLNATAGSNNIAQAYSSFIADAGGDTEANRQRAITYLRDIGISEDAIGQAYTTYLSGLPATTATTPAATATGNTYQGLSAASAPTNIAQAYETFVAGRGGDTSENQATAINYLRDLGLSDAQIGQAYNTYTAGTSTGNGMLSAGQSMTGTAGEPSYTNLAAASSPQSIAQAYADFVSASGGDTPENQRAAIDYLTNLGISQDTIGAAYGLFKGA